MDRLAFTAVVAINEQRIAKQMAVNEMANVATVGFKRSFEAATRAIKIEGSGAPRYQPQSFTEDFIQMKAGPTMTTGNPLDIAMSGATVLGVTAPDGQLAFSRRGDLRINAKGVLENGAGQLVRGQGGAPITAPPGLNITIQSDGTIFGQDPSQNNAAPPVPLGSLMLRDSSQVKLQRRTDGLFEAASVAVGEDFPTGPELPKLTAGALEGSNVNALIIMVKIIEQSRSFEQQINIIKEAKQNSESGQAMMKSG